MDREPERDARPVVFVVDDDVSVRESLELLISTAGWVPQTCSSAREFLSRAPVGNTWSAVVMGDLRRYKMLATTVEPAGGKLQPTGPQRGGAACRPAHSHPQGARGRR